MPPVAEPQFRKVIEKQPHGGAARAALVESLLYQRRYADAAAEAEHVRTDGAAAAGGRCAVSCSHACSSAICRVPRRLWRAPSSRAFPAPSATCSQSWLAAQRGALTPAPSAAGLALLALMLESLLRVQDFENFESLLPLLHRMPVPERERRELLAQMYLRRGFLRSAGREWMAVCEQQPDARALVGLAHVALANDQAEAAVTFASQALSLEPGNETARKLLELARAARRSRTGSRLTRRCGRRDVGAQVLETS